MAEHSLPAGKDLIATLKALGQALGYHTETEFPIERQKAKPQAIGVAWLHDESSGAGKQPKDRCPGHAALGKGRPRKTHARRLGHEICSRTGSHVRSRSRVAKRVLPPATCPETSASGPSSDQAVPRF